MNPKLQNSSLAGSVLAAFLASACCIGPVVFGLLGLTGVGFIAKFEAYRPYLIIVTVVLLAIGFYFTYRKKADCEPDSICANPRADRINKVVLWSVTAIAVALLFAPTILFWIL